MERPGDLNMPTKKKEPETILEQPITEEEQRTLLETAHKILLLCAGFFALAIEESEALLDRLAERGEIAEQDGRKLLREMKEKQKETASKAEKELYKNIESVTNRMSLASKDDITALNEQLNQISKQIDQLSKPKPKAGAANTSG
jgi:polyhydroxyalkanoate synthesis regulator phasin